jgi:hypothetical protein
MAVAQSQVTAQDPSRAGKPTSTTNQAKTAKPWTAPRTADDRPDLRGIWSNASLTPFERPKELAGKEFFTEEEAGRFAKTVLDQSNRDRRGATPEEDVGGAYNEAWFDRGTKVASNLRTSVVVDPADGKVPALTSEAREAAASVPRLPPDHGSDATGVGDGTVEPGPLAGIRGTAKGHSSFCLAASLDSIAAGYGYPNVGDCVTW